MSSEPDRFPESPKSVSKPESTPDPMNVPDLDPNQTGTPAQPPLQVVRPARPAAANPEPAKSEPASTPIATPSPSAAVTPGSEADSEADDENDATADSEAKSRRQQPIPPPSEPKQYRAIGLVLGRYEASEEQFNRGLIRTDDGVEIEAVLLGRITSLVKKHLDPLQEHLWVVYPRTREKEENLHLQIVGVWEPESLHKEEEEADELASKLQPPQPRKNYFSIRGEVISYEPETHKLTVKILQMPRRKTDTIKAFRLNLVGELPGARTVGHFWDLHVEREGEDLHIQRAQRIAMILPRKTKKKRFGGPGGGGGGGPRRKPSNQPYTPSSSPSTAPSRPTPRPVSRQNRPAPEESPSDES